MIHQFKAEGTEANLNFDINLEPNKRVYCFIGENGCGKTQLLENMAKGLVPLSPILYYSEKGKPYKYDGFLRYESFKDLIKKMSIGTARKYEINAQSCKESDTFLFYHLEYMPMNEKYFKVRFDFPFVFIGAKIRGHIRNVESDTLQILGNSSKIFFDAFLSTFNQMHGVREETSELTEWIISRVMLNSSFVSTNTKRENEVLALLEIIELLDSNTKTLLATLPKKLEVFKFHEGKLWFYNTPFDKLSTGYISILKIFQEIIAGYGGWIGAIGETDIRNTEGVVFIDEIESHLHAKWQYKIIPLLKEFFPKTTFYIATHSPLIVSTTNQDEAYELIREGDNVTAKKLGNPKNWYLADVYAQAFHVDFNDEAFQDETQVISLPEMLKIFSDKVKDYTVQPVEVLKEEINTLYKEILPNLGEDDPRKRSLDSLYSLVK